MLRLALLTGFIVTALLAPATAGAVCPPPLPYPGDTAEKPDIAQWMASGAAARGIPPELPVMAALVESSLTNARDGAADTAGYFAMREGIWNSGEYAGFPDQPDLQMKWFIDQATAQRARRIADGLGTAEGQYTSGCRRGTGGRAVALALTAAPGGGPRAHRQPVRRRPGRAAATR